MYDVVGVHAAPNAENRGMRNAEPLQTMLYRGKIASASQCGLVPHACRLELKS